MKKARKILSYLIMIVAIIALIVMYNKYNFNNFEKGIRKEGITTFTRDNNIKYGKKASYKIESKDYNDAMFSQNIKVTPNTPYKITCMIKTENVQNENNSTSGGAHICSNTTQERTKMITGTTNWQEITFMFNSKKATEVNIGFRLGGYETLSKGTVWFSDFKVEQGNLNNSNEWKMVCFIFPNIDVNVDINGKKENIKLQMSNNEVSTIKTNLSRFQSSIKEISKNKMSITYDTYVINQPITTLSYDKNNGYYVSITDIYDNIKDYIENNEYDHIYIAFRMADKQNGKTELTSDWIGLGGMEYMGTGFSNIRMPDDRQNLAYEFNYRVNTFPEEVFIHEFLHTLERNVAEYGYKVPALHDYVLYGYKEDTIQGLKQWYTDYMNQEITYQNTKIGLPEEIYTYKPVHKSNFKYSVQINELKEPEGIIEVVQSIIKRVQKAFTYQKIKQGEA